MKPFRWNIGRREQLGRLVGGTLAKAYPGFETDLRAASAKVLAASGGADPGFVGRSPESIFDYLSGVLAETAWADRLLLINLSLRCHSPSDLRRRYPEAIRSLRRHLFEIGASPEQRVRRRPLALIDLVSTGSTFRHLNEVLMAIADESGIERAAVRRKLRFVGITWKTRNSPNAYRWQQHAGWLNEFPRIAVKNVSIPGEMWSFLGNVQAKVTPSNPPWRWSDPGLLSPQRGKENIEALNRAVGLFDLGADPAERKRFSTELSHQHAMRHGWCRQLVSQLRGRSASRD